MKAVIAAGITVLAFSLSGCGSGSYGSVGSPNTSSENGNPNGSTPVTPPSSSTALFQPSAGVLPYPTDLYFAGSTDGTLNIQPANALMPNQAAVNALDGFSTTAVIRERFGGALNPASFTAASVIVVPVTTSNTTKATIGVLGAPLTPGTDYSAALATDAGVGNTILEITPLHPLMPSTCISGGIFLGTKCTTGTGYLVILTNAITDAAGNAAVPDTDYATIKAALASGGATCPAITDTTLNGICQLTGAQLQIAQALHINPANIVLTFSFTTESTLDTLALLSVTTPASTMKLNATGITTQQADAALAGHADLYVGVLSIPYYLSKSAPLTGSWNAPPFPLDPTSTFVTRFNPLPVATQTLLIPVLATVPNANSAYAQGGGPIPRPGGWPLLVFQHGITRSREDMLAVADSFADAGFAVVAIDLPLHGVTNTSDPLYATAANPLYAGLELPATGSIERTFDLALINPPAIDSSGSHFINLTSLLTSRDNVREGTADLLTLTRTLPSASFGAAGTVNAAAIHFLGHSLGAIVGSTFLGVVPAAQIGTATLASPGGGIAQLLIDSPTFAPEINAGLEAQGLAPGTTLYAQFFRDAQTVVDSGDPINFIALASAAHPIHMLQVVGGGSVSGCTATLPDQVVPNSATQRLITASQYGPLGLSRIPAPLAPGAQVDTNGTPPGFRAYLNYVVGSHGSIIDPTGCPAATVEMQTEAVSFTGVPIPPAGVPANTPGTLLLIANPTVLQP
jgi:pimeloyl-ACP methyl ester carboxylesterase